MTGDIQRVGGQFDAFAGASVFKDIIFTSGVIDPAALNDPSRTAREQCDATLGALVETVKLAGGDASTVLEVHAFLTSAAVLNDWNDAFTQTWPRQPPARTTVIAQLAAPGLVVEVRAVAAQLKGF